MLEDGEFWLNRFEPWISIHLIPAGERCPQPAEAAEEALLSREPAGVGALSQ